MATQRKRGGTPRPPIAPKDWTGIAKFELKQLFNELRSIVGYTDAHGKRHKGSLEKTLELEAQNAPELAENKNLYWKVIGFYIGMQISLIFACFRYNLYSHPLALDGLTINIGLTALLFQFGHLIASLRSVEVDELAGALFFGRPTTKPTNGLWLMPLGLLALLKEKRIIRDFLFPGPQEKIFRLTTEQAKKREDGENIPLDKEGKPLMVKPIFITTGKPRGDVSDKSDTLDRQFTIDVSWFIQLRMSDKHGGIFRIYRNIGRGEDAWEQAENLIKEQGVRALRGIFTTLTPATIIANEKLVSDVFALILTEIMMRRGFQVMDGGITDLNISHETNIALQEAQTRAPLKKLATIIEAEGERDRLTEIGKGVAEAERLRLVALGEGYKRIRDATGVSGEAALASETAKIVLANSDTVLIGTDGLREALGFLVTAKSFFERTRTPLGIATEPTQTEGNE